MDNRRRFGLGAVAVLALSAGSLLPAVTHADPGNNYCITPAFVSGNIPPNLLLMIDNSASMYDLEFVDKGKKHCSTSGAACFLDSDCGASGGTCSTFDRQPYYCYDQTYSTVKLDGTANTYAGYFQPKDSAGNDIFYTYRSASNDFAPVSTAFPSGCNINGTTTTTARSITSPVNTMCVEYTNDNKSLVSFVANGNYLNWLTASKFDIEKQILTGGKFVNKVCSGDSNRACAADTDCLSPQTCGAAPNAPFLLPESRGCVGQGFIKDAITGNFVNYNSPASNNTNSQLGVTFAVHGPINPADKSAPSTGGQTYIDVFPVGKAYDYGSCQNAVATLANTSSTNAQVKQAVAACLSGTAGGTCQYATSNLANCTVSTTSGNFCNCFSTYPDCSAPQIKVCSGNLTKVCTSNTNCLSGEGTCSTPAYYCEASDGSTTNTVCTQLGKTNQCPAVSYWCDEGNTSASGYTSPTPLTKTCTGTTDTTSCAATYWCDWGAEWMSSAHAAYPNGNNSGYTCDAPTSNDPACQVQNTQQGQCSLPDKNGHYGTCHYDTDCSTVNQGVCLGYKSNSTHACVQHTPPHGTCRAINGATNGICGAQQNYGSCIFGSSDVATKTKVNFQQTMQACWQYNRYQNGVSGGADIGTDDLKTLDNQCSSIYNGGGNTLPFKTCSNNPNKTCCQVSGTCSAAQVTADCGTGTCNDGPNAIVPGNPAYICGSAYAGALYYKDSLGVWIKEGSLNDSSTLLKNVVMLDPGTSNQITISIPSACTPNPTDYTFPGCMKKIEQNFCAANTAPGVADPTDAPSDTSTYDNLPAILSGIGVESQLGAPIATMRARVTVATPACTKDSDCATGKSCSSGVCKPAGLIQQYGGQIRLGAMTFNQFGSSSETSLAGVGIPKTCSNDPSQSCTQDVDCGVDSNGHALYQCNPTTAGTSNLDAGKVAYPIGLGVCTTMTSTPCTTDSNCLNLGASYSCVNSYCGAKSTTSCTTALTCIGSSQACTRNTPGDHSSSGSLIQTIDQVRANAWTPFAETFYNALGYFAAIPQTGGSFKSRGPTASTATGYTSVRLNSGDFAENQHPSEYYCQLNNILLVTDGSSTADRNTTSYNLGSTYAANAGVTTTTGTACPYCCPKVNNVDYGGTFLLPVMSWIGAHENLATFSTGSATNPLIGTCSVSGTACSTDRDCTVTGESCSGGLHGRDYVSTFVVFNGTDTGSTSACDPPTLLRKTATNGGTTMQQASDPAALSTALSTIFQNIAAKASSGTAASILSNSEGSGANILQAVFYPSKIFSNNTSANWVGEMQNLWYYVDPQINNSTIREDTDGDHTLNLLNDKVVTLQFNSTDNTTYAYTQTDLNGDGSGDTPASPGAIESVDDVKSIWRAGKQLWARSALSTPRTIYTPFVTGATQVGSTGLMKFNFGTIDTTKLFPTNSGNFTLLPDNSSYLQSYLQMPDSASTKSLMAYVHGFDFPADATFRNRTVQIKDANGNATAGVWKLGDIISSTPRIQSNVKLNSYGQSAPSGYSDASYNSYLGSTDYKGRGMVYVGANDGMLHAFKLGVLDVTANNFTKATLTGTGLGEEQWAYIPKQALPYLKYYSDPAYNHLYFIDGSTLIVDASIGDHSDPNGCTSTNYDTCTKFTSVVGSTNALDPAKNTWRTVLLGGMGLGGATTSACPNSNGNNCVQTPTTDPATPANGLGYSSYYALDVSDPNAPSLLWEFSDTALGYATSGPAVVRVGDPSKNGHWYAVFGSGPTGPIDTSHHQFMGRSDQTLKFFVVDLRTGSPVKTIDTGIANAFAGSMLGGAIDADRWNVNTTGNYQDDAIYVGYTKKSDTTGAWTDGGVLRIVTNESPANSTGANEWTWSTVIDGVGPVTTAISRLQDRKNKALWLYFGSGRYYSRAGSVIDDYDTQRAIYGVKDPCYTTGNNLDKTCMRSQTASVSAVALSSLTDQSTSITPASGIAHGWQVTLDPSTTTYGAERVVTDAVALTNGVVFVTSFEPTADLCGFGGNSFLWALDYASGGRPADAVLAGKALIQLSTGAFQQVDLSQVFGTGSSRLMRRANQTLTGKPPSDAFPVVSKSSNKPIKRILHIQER